jgi:hypothetical protein
MYRPLAAADEGGSVFGDHWGVRIGLNYSSWDGLGDLEPAGTTGRFETTGNGLEFEAYTSIAKMENNWLFAGVSIGFLGFNTSLLEPDFGTIEAVGADSGDLKGPIYTVYLDWGFGRW